MFKIWPCYFSFYRFKSVKPTKVISNLISHKTDLAFIKYVPLYTCQWGLVFARELWLSRFSGSIQSRFDLVITGQSMWLMWVFIPPFKMWTAATTPLTTTGAETSKRVQLLQKKRHENRWIQKKKSSFQQYLSTKTCTRSKNGTEVCTDVWPKLKLQLGTHSR